MTNLNDIISNANAVKDIKIGMTGIDSKTAKAKYLKLSNIILASEKSNKNKGLDSDSANSERRVNIAKMPKVMERIKNTQKIESLFLNAFNIRSIFRRSIITRKSRPGGLSVKCSFLNIGLCILIRQNPCFWCKY